MSEEPKFVNLTNNILFPCSICNKLHNVLGGYIYIINILVQAVLDPRSGLQVKHAPALVCKSCYDTNKESLGLIEPSKIITAPPPGIIKGKQ